VVPTERLKPDNREMYDLYQQEIIRLEEKERKEVPDLFPAIKGLKSVTHDQFLRMRDGYVTKSEITRREIESHE